MPQVTPPTPKILIVEDDALLNSMLKERLSDEGFDVAVCTDGLLALKKIDAMKPNLVVLGLILPTVSGLEVLAKMRANPRTKDTPAIVLSQLHRKEDVRMLDVLGTCEYLVKTDYTLSEMVDRIKANIDCSPTRSLFESVSK